MKRKSRFERKAAALFEFRVKTGLLAASPFTPVHRILCNLWLIPVPETGHSRAKTAFLTSPTLPTVARLEAANAAEALTIIDATGTIDLLFTDVIMPGAMNGRQLVDEASKRRPSLKVLYTSGYTENAIVHHGRLDTCVLLLTKPYRKSELARMLRLALGS
jgi:CheY-like chemotaxis protein